MLSTLRKDWQSPLWWLPAAAIAAALKWHFSTADAATLFWMLRPLALLLELLSGWHFQRNAVGDWESVDAGIVLVKACAGINFMIMSFIGWCWIARPDGRALRTTQPWLEWPLMYLSALVLAWMTALLVNVARVFAVIHVQTALEHWLSAESAHRAIGLSIYFPALSAQLLIQSRGRWLNRVILAALIYIAVMLLVPMLTGNAFANPELFRDHLLLVILALAPVAILGALLLLQRVALRARRPLPER